MLKLGEADALLCGSYGQYAWHLRYVLNVIDKKPVGAVAALSALVLPSGTYFFTDTYVNPDPTQPNWWKLPCSPPRRSLDWASSRRWR